MDHSRVEGAPADECASPGERFAHMLRAAGFDFFAGVPCSLLSDVITHLERHAGYVPETREDAALGLAAGAYLGGRRPVVLMQNSGVGVSVNALSSLLLLYRIPALLVVSWRGYGGKDAPEHLQMGAVLPQLLDVLGIPYRCLQREGMRDAVAWGRAEVEARRVAALLVTPGVLG